MTKASTVVKNLPAPPPIKQLAATGLIVVAGLLIFLIIGILAPESSSMIDAGIEFDVHPLPQPASDSNSPTAVPSLLSLVPSTKPKVPLALDLTKGSILSDHDNRIPDIFQIPKGLERQTALYFDLFTKYPEDCWLIVSDGPVPSVIEEWSFQKLTQQLAPPLNQTKIEEWLNIRLAVLAKQNQNLRIQRGLRDTFLVQIESMSAWLPLVEKIFKKHKFPSEYSRIFLVPNNTSLAALTAPWTTPTREVANAYLLKNKIINEGRSPLKVVRALTTVIKGKQPKSFHWNDYLKSNYELDAAFYAALYADAYQDELHLDPINPKPLSEVKAFKLSRETSVEELTQQLKISLSSFFKGNPDLLQKSKQTLLPKDYVFFVVK